MLTAGIVFIKYVMNTRTRLRVFLYGKTLSFFLLRNLPIKKENDTIEK